MTQRNKKSIVLPALRGIMGDWVYYSCLMSLDEVSKRVSYASEIHSNKKLSGMIQRSLKAVRSEQISDYLSNQDERFFNSLVIATYGGQPNWTGLDNISSSARKEFVGELSEETVNSVGFLSLDGSEKLFALDGQHRLSGIKKAIADGLNQDPPDDLSVIFVAHKTTKKGLQRTRRLFTTLNKTAKPVSKGDIIALDEDDVMAICVRKLIEETSLFQEERIAFVASNNMPVTNFKSLTTIGNLYDILVILFTSVETNLKLKKTELQRSRPDDAKLQQYFELSQRFFKHMGKNFEELGEFLSADNSEKVVRMYRGSHGGDALFRPIGLAVITEVIAHLSKNRTMEESIKLAGKLNTSLSTEPFEGLMWDSASKRIDNSKKVTLRETLLYMLGASKLKDSTLLERYQKDFGDGNASLPKPLV